MNLMERQWFQKTWVRVRVGFRGQGLEIGLGLGLGRGFVLSDDHLDVLRRRRLNEIPNLHFPPVHEEKRPLWIRESHRMWGLGPVRCTW